MNPKGELQNILNELISCCCSLQQTRLTSHYKTLGFTQVDKAALVHGSASIPPVQFIPSDAKSATPEEIDYWQEAQVKAMQQARCRTARVLRESCKQRRLAARAKSAVSKEQVSITAFSCITHFPAWFQPVTNVGLLKCRTRTSGYSA